MLDRPAPKLLLLCSGRAAPGSTAGSALLPNRQLWAARLQQLLYPKHKSPLSCALQLEKATSKFKEPTAVLSPGTEVWLRWQWGIGYHLYKDKDFTFLVFSLEVSIENQLTDQTKTHKPLEIYFYSGRLYFKKPQKLKESNTLQNLLLVAINSHMLILCLICLDLALPSFSACEISWTHFLRSFLLLL